MQTDEPGLPGSGMAMYEDEADWFHLLTAPAEYADEAAFILRTLPEHVTGPMETLLELGSGGGNTASHLKANLRLTLTDVAPAMIALSETLNPECEHLLGDMRSLRVGRQFDAVLIHDAIMYMTTEADLRAALDTAFVHCRAGGAGIFVPDFTRETFKPETQHGGHDGVDRALRYLEWSYDPDPADTSIVTEFAMLLREGPDSTRVRYDRHVEGLFAHADWIRFVTEARFDVSSVEDPYGRSVFVGRRPRQLPEQATGAGAWPAGDG